MSIQFKKIRAIGEKLLKKSENIRAIFRKFDTGLYGYLTTAQYDQKKD